MPNFPLNISSTQATVSPGLYHVCASGRSNRHFEVKFHPKFFWFWLLRPNVAKMWLNFWPKDCLSDWNGLFWQKHYFASFGGFFYTLLGFLLGEKQNSSFGRPLCGTYYNTVPLICSIGSAKYVKFSFHYAWQHKSSGLSILLSIHGWQFLMRKLS